MAEGSERQREQFQHIVDDWADLANRLVSRSAALAKRVVRQGPEERAGRAGPLQDLWMTMADAAGDMAELSCKWVQAVDGLSGFSQRSASDAAGAAAPDPDARQAATPGPTIAPGASKPASKKAATARRTDGIRAVGPGHSNSTSSPLVGELSPPGHPNELQAIYLLHREGGEYPLRSVG